MKILSKINNYAISLAEKHGSKLNFDYKSIIIATVLVIISALVVEVVFSIVKSYLFNTL